MNRKEFVKLVKEARTEFSSYSVEQRVRVLEKIEAIDKKIRLQEETAKISKLKSETINSTNGPADFIEEK